ncbi:hypothetical protein T440DRAFT_57288 [Plenodomus tracheiphilus IPT5]|uniref:C2H2-type domain-containing protein n=1 Tax=Plenodomus tracheiphilus IPT5 TaxID=1408161 RepID=A0A6A7B8R6_9PLEO|nr:hypothetical protein T440DRAFT_57288 [Plenodomus tracheiphilus IPT5]
MVVELESIRRVKCTYKDCSMSFDSEKIMKRHKRYFEDHDYCHLCDEDFDCIEDYIEHKITRPVEHDKACRVCGDEFKSDSGLKRHIELNHKVDQKLPCIGCQKSFYRACLFIEHLEFGHCDVIAANQFQGHIVHKHLITEFLNNGPAYARFKQKTSKYDAAVDYEEEGGIELEEDPLDVDDAIEEVKFDALEPDVAPETPLPQVLAVPYPPLPSQVDKGWSEVASSLGALSVSGDSETSTIIASRTTATFPAPTSTYSLAESSVQGSRVASSSRRSRAWGSRAGKITSNILFPNAKPTPAPSEFSIEAHDESIEQQGINIMRTRFWDPMSSDWNPEKFYDSVISKYACPFICEQTFHSVGDLNQHILGDHRITRMKCPTCLKYFKSATALVAHCESRGARCQINKADNFNIFLDRISGGFLGVEEQIRPDHLNNRTVFITDPQSGRMEKYRAPVASYLQYVVTTPPDWKEPVRGGVQIGGIPSTASQW